MRYCNVEPKEIMPVVAAYSCEKMQHVTAARITDAVVFEAVIPLSIIRTGPRWKHFSDTRIILAKLLRTYSRMSLKAIGGYMDKNHSTVIYYLKVFEAYYSTEPAFRKRYHTIRVAAGLKREETV